MSESVKDLENLSIKHPIELFRMLESYRFESNMSSGDDKKIELIRNRIIACTAEYSNMFIETNYDSDMQYEFLKIIEDAIDKKTTMDWNSIILLIENYIRKSPDNPHVSHNVKLQSCRIIKNGLMSKRISSDFQDRVFNIIKQFITLSNNDMIGNEDYDGGIDSLSVSINTVNGLSFHMLFAYILWSNNNSECLFTSEIKEILEEYINTPDAHTVSRHAIIGLYYPVIYDLDSKRASMLIQTPMFANESMKIAFWDSCVSYNNASRTMLLQLHRLYDEFLNKPITNKIKGKRLYYNMIEHVILGYLANVQYFDRIFAKFILQADESSIKHCGDFITRVLHTNSNHPKDKIVRLWKHPKFINHGELYRWFLCKPFEKKLNIDLHLEYLMHYSLNYNEPFTDAGMFTGLDEYIDAYPETVARCMLATLEIFDPHHTYGIKFSTLQKLKDKKIDQVDNICKNIIKILVRLGQKQYMNIYAQ